jgi:hypothetical protein
VVMQRIRSLTLVPWPPLRGPRLPSFPRDRRIVPVRARTTVCWPSSRGWKFRKNILHKAADGVVPSSHQTLTSARAPRTQLWTGGSCVKMATDTYPTGISHLYPHPLSCIYRVTHNRTRVGKYFHTRTRAGKFYPTGNPHPTTYPRITYKY